jgi:hypothetical protein
MAASWQNTPQNVESLRRDKHLNTCTYSDMIMSVDIKHMQSLRRLSSYTLPNYTVTIMSSNIIKTHLLPIIMEA